MTPMTATVIAFKRKKPDVCTPAENPSAQEAQDITAALATGLRSMHEAREFALAMGLYDAMERFAKETLELVEAFRGKSEQT